MRVGDKIKPGFTHENETGHDPSRAGSLHQVGAPARIEPEDSFDAYLREIEVGMSPGGDDRLGEDPWSTLVRAGLDWNEKLVDAQLHLTEAKDPGELSVNAAALWNAGTVAYQEVFQAQMEACQGLMRAWSASSSPTPERLRHRR